MTDQFHGNAKQPKGTTGTDPLDLVWLGSWLQPHHLDTAAIDSYRERFRASPVSMLVLKDFLNESVASRLSSFINQEAELELQFGLHSAAGNDAKSNPSVSEAVWQAANEQDRFYRLRKFVRVAEGKQLTPNFAAYLSFLAAFKNPKFRGFFEAITGLKFDLSNETHHLYAYKAGDFLGRHNDRATECRLLAFILYLSPEWESRFGGSLSIASHDGEVTKLDPEYNSLVLFNVEGQAEHFVSVINECAGDRGRTTFSGWLHRPAA